MNRLFTFIGGGQGIYRVTRSETIRGESLQAVERLAVVSGEPAELLPVMSWSLRGITSYERYTNRSEKERLLAHQPALGRPEATCAAFIPIRKNVEWWGLPQDARRQILAESSRHIEIGLQYLPAVARRLYHCRDLGENEPFDFLAWLEFAPAHSSAFDELVDILRRTEEWQYVEREIDIRVVRESV